MRSCFEAEFHLRYTHAPTFGKLETGQFPVKLCFLADFLNLSNVGLADFKAPRKLDNS